MEHIICVGLFTIEIYANWVRKEELEKWYSHMIFGVIWVSAHPTKFF